MLRGRVVFTTDSGAIRRRVAERQVAPFMPITPYLAHQAFEPESIETMSAAFAAACQALHLKAGDDPATRFVAEKVIELAQRGIRDPDELRSMTLKEFGLSDESCAPREWTQRLRMWPDGRRGQGQKARREPTG